MFVKLQIFSKIKNTYLTIWQATQWLSRAFSNVNSWLSYSAKTISGDWPHKCFRNHVGLCPYLHSESTRWLYCYAFPEGISQKNRRTFACWMVKKLHFTTRHNSTRIYTFLFICYTYLFSSVMVDDLSNRLKNWDTHQVSFITEK